MMMIDYGSVFGRGRLGGGIGFDRLRCGGFAGHDCLAPDADVLSIVLGNLLGIAHMDLLESGAGSGPSRRGRRTLVPCLEPDAFRVAPGDDRPVCQTDVVPVLGESLGCEVVRGRVSADDLACVPTCPMRAFVVPDLDLVVERFCFLCVYRNLLGFQGFVPQPKDMFALFRSEVKPIDAFYFNKLSGFDLLAFARILTGCAQMPTATVRARGVVRAGRVGFANPAHKTARIADVTIQNHERIEGWFCFFRGANLRSRKPLISLSNGGARCP